jgi:hypothetical protein
LIRLTGQNGQIDLSKKMMKGDDGGYYIPTVEDGVLSWKPSEEDMEPVVSVDITGPQGLQGEPGADGKNTVWTGDTEPTDGDYNVWIAPGGEASGLVTQEQMEQYVVGAMPDTSNYATKDEIPDTSLFVTGEYVQTAINQSLPNMSEYAKKDEIPSLDGYAKTADIPDTSSFVDETRVNELIAQAMPASTEGVKF